MSMFETGHSSGAVSLSGLVAGVGSVSCPDPGLDLTDLTELVCRGGWPAGLQRSLPDAQRGVRDYLDEIRRADIHTVDGVRRDPIRVGAVLAALARNVATEVTQPTLAADAAGISPSGRPRTETVSCSASAWSPRCSSTRSSSAASSSPRPWCCSAAATGGYPPRSTVCSHIWTWRARSSAAPSPSCRKPDGPCRRTCPLPRVARHGSPVGRPGCRGRRRGATASQPGR
jgi:hypothetical protein